MDAAPPPLSALKSSRGFFQYQVWVDTEVPDESVFGRVPGRTTPHVYRDQEIVELLAAAGQLGPAGGLL